MSDPPPDVWHTALAATARAGGPCLIVGDRASDVTRYAEAMAQRLDAEEPCFHLDIDPAAGRLTLPGCIAARRPGRPAISAFAGTLVPPERPVEWLRACARLRSSTPPARSVVEAPPVHSASDWIGLLDAAWEIFAPTTLVIIGPSPLYRALLRSAPLPIGKWIEAPEDLSTEGPPHSYELSRRALRISAYFRAAEVRPYRFRDVPFAGLTIGAGTPVPAHLLRYLNENLGPARIYHAEMIGPDLSVVANRQISAETPEVGVALRQLKAARLQVTVAGSWKRLLVGLEHGSRLMGLGLIHRLDLRGGAIEVLTPVRSAESATLIRAGSVRVSASGVLST